MKSAWSLLVAICVLGVCLTGSTAFADDGCGGCKEKDGGCGKGPMMDEKFIKKWDTDGDGQVSKEEMEAAHKAFEEKKAAFIKQWDTDGDGKLNDEERKAAKDAFHKSMLEKYDADGNGELSKEELEKARDDEDAMIGPWLMGGPGKHKGPGKGWGKMSEEEMKAHHEEMLKKYDADGELSKEEMKKAMEDKKGCGGCDKGCGDDK